MKYRKDFVTNSSSSSYICEICGRNESGWDMSLSDAEMIECVNGHTICDGELLDVQREDLIKEILEWKYKDYEWTESELSETSDEELLDIFFGLDDARYETPECFCPICQFIEYSNEDLARYLERKYGVSRLEVLELVKTFNKRRKKLYDSEYVAEVCNRFDLNPAHVVAGLKDEFGTYKKFMKYINRWD